MDPVSTACSLVADDADVRVDEWRQFVSRRVVEIIRSDTCARMRLVDGDDTLLVATDLARREKACCPFFGFRLELLAEAVWLEVEVPEEAAAILEGLVDLRPS